MTRLDSRESCGCAWIATEPGICRSPGVRAVGCGVGLEVDHEHHFSTGSANEGKARRGFLKDAPHIS